MIRNKPSDRRKTGVHTTHVPDGNGGVFSLITATFSTAKVVVTSLIAVGTLLGGVYAAVRTGVGQEVHQQIDAAARDKHGAIHVEILRCVEAHADEFEEKFSDEFKEIRAVQSQEHDAVIRTEEQLTALDRKVDANQQELLRAIERAGGG